MSELLSVEKRDILAGKVVDFLNGDASAGSVINLASSHESEMASFAWVVINRDKDLNIHARMDEFAVAVIQEAARLVGNVALSSERVSAIVSGTVAEPIAENEFGALVHHWKDSGAFTTSGMRAGPQIADRFEISLEVMSKADLEFEAAFAKQARDLRIAGAAARQAQSPRPKMG